jgi:hypothetical protein
MGNFEKVEITEGTILNIDLTIEGEIVYKVRKEEGGRFERISKQELNAAVVKKDQKIEGRLSFIKALSLTGIRKNPFKVYVFTGDRIMCYLFDSNTWEYLGSC